MKQWNKEKELNRETKKQINNILYIPWNSFGLLGLCWYIGDIPFT